jgi:hypothetical protein
VISCVTGADRNRVVSDSAKGDGFRFWDRPVDRGVVSRISTCRNDASVRPGGVRYETIGLGRGRVEAVTAW